MSRDETIASTALSVSVTRSAAGRAYIRQDLPRINSEWEWKYLTVHLGSRAQVRRSCGHDHMSCFMSNFDQEIVDFLEVNFSHCENLIEECCLV